MDYVLGALSWLFTTLFAVLWWIVATLFWVFLWLILHHRRLCCDAHCRERFGQGRGAGLA